MNLQTQDCYIPVKNDEGTHLQKYLAGMMEKRSGVIILNLAEFTKAVGDAFDAGERFSIDHDYLSISSTYTAPNKIEYINQLITHLPDTGNMV